VRPVTGAKLRAAFASPMAKARDTLFETGTSDSTLLPCRLGHAIGMEDEP
jgi:hypothetical protein